MAETKIEWADMTFNPWIGCTKVAEGCKSCYAEAYAKRYGKAIWGPQGTRSVTTATYWRQPLKWNREAQASGIRKRIFCASLADVFEDWPGQTQGSFGGDHDERWRCVCGFNGFQSVILREFGPQKTHDDCPLCGKRLRPETIDDVRGNLFALIDATPWLDWLLLTKRPENVLRMTPCDPNVQYRENVWLGTSISTQSDADQQIPLLLQCRDLSPVLFLSAEPLLGPVQLPCGDDVERLEREECGRSGCGIGMSGSGIDWVIIGGESGPHARPCDVSWIRSLRDQCKAADVACFVKQLGAMPCDDGMQPAGGWWNDQRTKWQDNLDGLWKYGRYLRDPKGGDWSEWPADLRVREFPEVAP